MSYRILRKTAHLSSLNVTSTVLSQRYTSRGLCYMDVIVGGLPLAALSALGKARKGCRAAEGFNADPWLYSHTGSDLYPFWS